MILKQYYLGCLSHASYLIGDEESKTAAIVDPQRDIDQYLEDAKLHGLNIRHVFLTHFHADFVAGHLELKERVSSTIYLGARAEAEYEFTPLKDGDVIEFGKVRLEILETPGHSPESISILAYDLTKDLNDPYAVLTGDTLFIGDVGRPDLRASLGWSATELGSMLYDSLRNKILGLPDKTLVYPTHGAGSMCGKNLSKETVSTIGIQRKYNYALQPMSKEEFVKIVTADQPEAPEYFTYDAILNTKEHQTLRETMKEALRPQTLDEVIKLEGEGAQILDVRDPVDFEGAHLGGSINIGLGGKYATWAGTILERDKPILIIAEAGREEEAIMRLGRIGFDHIAGYLDGGMESLLTRPDLLKRTERITALTLAEQISSRKRPVILDVRTENEWKFNRIEGSVNIPLNQLKDRINEIPRDQRIVVHCASGYRSSISLGLLEKYKFPYTSDLVGGISAWEAAKLQTKH
ncbi:MBL fold metallo-hydrolase [Desulfobacterota bacterium AH_259_B03_O07]|nr:MBL fold metallo-hydrolase [Desulfobacterota bacterium AH_259_B03_O07]